MQWMACKDMMQKIPYLRVFILCSLTIVMAWVFLAPSPIPFGIEIQRELGFVGHVAMFALVSLICFMTFDQNIRQVVAILLGSAVGLEVAQAIIPDRGADIVDFLMNGAGIVIGYFIFSKAHTFQMVSQLNRTKQTVAARATAIGHCEKND